MDDQTRQLADDLIEALQPADAHWRAMFGGACFYVDGKVAGLINNGAVFVKRSRADEELDNLATLTPAYPGASNTWRLHPGLVEENPDALRSAVLNTAKHLPAPRPK